MAGKRKQADADAEKDATPKQIELVIKHEHVVSAHSIEIRRNGGKTILEARLEDHRHSETLGAKTVEAILKENGAELPDGSESLVITFSPYNGEIVSIAAKVEKPYNKAIVGDDLNDNSEGKSERNSGELDSGQINS